MGEGGRRWKDFYSQDIFIQCKGCLFELPESDLGLEMEIMESLNFLFIKVSYFTAYNISFYFSGSVHCPF